MSKKEEIELANSFAEKVLANYVSKVMEEKGLMHLDPKDLYQKALADMNKESMRLYYQNT